VVQVRDSKYTAELVKEYERFFTACRIRVVAVIHNMEASGNVNSHLHKGNPRKEV